MKFTVKVDEKLGRKFRAKVVEVKGNKKGALSEAIEEAIKLCGKTQHKNTLISTNFYENRNCLQRQINI